MSDNQFEEHLKEKIESAMWDKVLDAQCRAFMKHLIRDEEGVIGEDDHVIDSFFEHIKINIKDYKVVVVLATQWMGYEEKKQTIIAVNYVGWRYASHFMMLMDFLANKFLKGELK